MDFVHVVEIFIQPFVFVVLALEKDDAVNEWRRVIGATNSAEDEEGAIRKIYAKKLRAECGSWVRL